MILSSFVAIDFETANYYRNSACAVGMVKVVQSRIVEEQVRLICPPDSWFNMSGIHGITWEDVRDEPNFKEVWQDMQYLLEGANFLAAHNAPFDKSVMNKCCEHYKIKPAPQQFICTVKLAREQWDLNPTKLPNVCDFLGIELDHHEALSDARACAKIIITAAKEGVVF